MSFGWVGEIVDDEEEREARGSFHFFDSPLIKVTFGNLGGRQIFSPAADFHSCPPPYSRQSVRQWLSDEWDTF
jgi:hypothetical protein